MTKPILIGLVAAVVIYFVFFRGKAKAAGTSEETGSPRSEGGGGGFGDFIGKTSPVSPVSLPPVGGNTIPPPGSSSVTSGKGLFTTINRDTFDKGKVFLNTGPTRTYTKNAGSIFVNVNRPVSSPSPFVTRTGAVDVNKVNTAVTNVRSRLPGLR